MLHQDVRNEGPETAIRGGVNGSLKFLSKLWSLARQTTPKANYTKVVRYMC
jgi:hypothetical protein